MRTTTCATTRIVFSLFVLFLTFASIPSKTFAAKTAGAAAGDVQTKAAPQARVVKPVNNAERKMLVGHVPRALKHATDAGRVAPNTPAQHLIMTLKSSSEQEREIRKVIDEQQDKRTANYHQWMTPETFGEHFGVDDADIAKVTAWLKSQGFTVESVTKAKRAIVFSGNVGQLENAFQTEMHYFKMPSGEMHVSNNSEISVPEALHPVIAGVPTMNNFFRRPHKTPMRKVSQLKSGPKLGSGGSSTYVGPADFATIYNTAPLLASGINGTGITIGIVGRSDILMSDVQTYRQMFNLPVNDPVFIHAGQDIGIEGGDDGESDLDVEISGGIAPAAKVDFVIGTPDFLVDGITNSIQYLVENNAVDIISTSYGDCESNEGAGGNSFNSQMWEQAAAQGISVFVADGDNGPAECDDSNDSYEVLGYAASAEASTWYGVSVGGTQFNEGAPAAGPNPTYWSGTNNPLQLNSALSYIPEYPWNEAKNATPTSTPAANLSGLWSGSGGISAYYLLPPWQVGPGVPVTDPALTQGGNWIIVNITNPGSGYTSAPSVTFTGETCASNPVTASTTLSSGAVASVVYNDGTQGGTLRTGQGFGCTVAGTVAFTAAPIGGTTATGTAVLAPMQNILPIIPGVPHRYTPDLALNAAADHDGTLFCSEGICQIGPTGQLLDAGIVGGTSVAAPSMAGIQALIDQANGGRQGMPGYIYYSLAAAQSATNCNSSLPPVNASGCAFQDVTVGNNLICGTSSCTTSPAKIGFQAGSGYDLATGLGSVNAANLSSQWSTVHFNSTSTTLNLPAGPFTHGSTVVLNGTVTGTGTPTGDVVIIVSQGAIGDTVNLNTGALNGPVAFTTLSGGSYSISLNNLPGGSYNITARYGGDDSNASSYSTSYPITVASESGSFTLTASSPNATTTCALTSPVSYPYGSNILIDAYVAGVSGAGAATGTVTISDNGTPIATNQTLDPNGHAFLLSGPISSSNCLYQYDFANTPTFTVGTHNLTATYSGDASVGAVSAIPNPVTVVVTQDTPTLTLAAGATQITSGFSEQLTATFGGLTPITGGSIGSLAPTGTVTFKDATTSATLGVANVTSASVTTINAQSTAFTAVAALQTNGITAAGANSITATYNGDTNWAPVTSSGVTVTVGTFTTATTTTVTNAGTGTLGNPSTLAARPTFTVTVSGGAGPTNGTVTVYDGTTVLGTGTVGSGHTTTVRVPTSPAFVGGVHSITATFGGVSGTFGPSSSASPYMETVTQGTTANVLSAKTVGASGQAYYFTDVVTPSPSSSTYQLAANVQFFDGATLIGSAPLYSVSGNNGGYGILAANLSVNTLTAGTHTITAQYSDINYALSTSNAQTVFVGGTPTVTWATPAAITYGTALSATQLNATANIPGTFVYSPAAGTVLNAGTQMLSVTFKPADYTDFGPQIQGNSLQVNQASQTITFTMNAPPSAVYNSQFTVAATGGASGNPVVFTSSGSCSNVGATYTMTSGSGTCSVIANQASSSNYSAAPQVTQSVNATMAGGGAISVSLTAGSNSIYTKQSDPLTATVSVTGPGGAPAGPGEIVNFYNGAALLGSGRLSTVDANDSSVTFTINGSLLSLGANSNVYAVYVGDANYSSSTSPSIAITVLSPLVSLGSSSVGTAAPTQTVTYTFSAPATLTSVNVLTLGISGLDYTNGSGSCAAIAYTAGQSCTVIAGFTPTAPGARSGGATLYASGSNQPLMTWYLSGIGQSGAVTIDPGTLTTTTLTGTLTPVGYGSAVDGAGNVYVVDNANKAVLKLAAGTFSQSTVVSGLSGPTGVALDGAGNLYISDGSSVVFVPNESGTLNPADKSTVSIGGLGAARGIAVDNGDNLYVSDATYNDVVELSGLGVQTTIASSLTGPHGVAVDAGGNVYVATNNAVTEYPFGGGVPVPYGTGFNNPRGVAVDAAGNVYVADTGNNRIVEVAPGGATQTVLAIAGLSAPQGVSLDSLDNLYVTDPSILIQDNRTQAAQLNFPSTPVDSTSAAQNLTVSDSGNQQLQISNLAISANFAQGVSGGTDCTSSTALSAAGQCLIAVEFAPTVSGTLTGTVTINDNALNGSGTSTVQLSGGGSQVGQTITFSMNAPASATYNSQFTVAASASSGLPVAYTSSGGCTNVGATYTMTSGTTACTVIANQAGNVEYAAAPQVTQNVNATLASQTITFTMNAPASAAYQSSFNVAASASSGLAVTFTSSGVCTNSGGSYTMTSGTGTCSVIANQAGNTNYSVASQVTQSTAATKIGQTITFSINAPGIAPYQSSFTVAASASSSLAVAYTSSGVCTNVGATYTMNAASGTCTVIANQAGNGNYNAAPQVTQSTTASKAAPTVTFTGAPATAPYQSTFTVTATTNASTHAVITAGGACSVAGTTVTMTKGSGTCTVTAKWAADTHYLAATVAQTTTATKLATTVSWTTPSPITYGTPLSGTQLDATASVAGHFAYTPASGSIQAAGSHTLSVKFTPTNSTDYAPSTGSVTLTVNKISTTTTITSTTPSAPNKGENFKVFFTVTATYGKPTQSVTVSSGGGPSCTASLAAGKGSCTLNFPTAGPQTLTATYGGDSNDLGSPSAPYSVTIGN